jgi:hypothetical protein
VSEADVKTWDEPAKLDISVGETLSDMLALEKFPAVVVLTTNVDELTPDSDIDETGEVIGGIVAD